MKAVIIKEPGAANNLTIAEAAVSRPGPGEVSVEVAFAAAISPTR
jgi:NADPH:quinone reductase-like Zn-dependent oxidoreductase